MFITKVCKIDEVEWGPADEEMIKDEMAMQHAQESGDDVCVLDVAVDQGEYDDSYYMVVDRHGHIVEALAAVHIVDQERLKAFYRKHK